MAKKKGVRTNLAGESAKHKNHTVPKGLLKRWLAENEGKKGYWVLDCNSGTVQFRKGENASFAIKEFRYVPVRYTKEGTAYRDEWLENWFSLGESDLAAVIDKVVADKIDAVTDKVRTGFITAVIMLGFRSAYEFSCVESLLRDRSPDSSDEEIGRDVVDHFASLYATKLAQFKNWDFKLFNGMDEPLLLGDRPLFDMTVTASKQQGMLIALTPDHFLSGTPPEDPTRTTMSFAWLKGAGGKMAAQLNHMTAERARQFIVGEKEQLIALQPHFSEQKFTERKSKDTFSVSIRVRRQT